MDANSQIGFALNHIANFSAATVQMNLQRFWTETLAQPRYADPKRLLRYGFKVYSQHDEDGIIQEIFRRIGTGPRTFVEFGVETGVECNTVKLLIEGWRGLWIEANAQACKAIASSFDPFLKDRRLVLQQSLVTAENINTLVEKGGLKGEIDLLGIDIDFNDYWVWKAIEAVSPRVVVIEYNAGLRPPMSLTVPYQPNHAGGGTNFFGASLEALVRLGRSQGLSRGRLQYLRLECVLRARGSVRRSFHRARDRGGALRAAAPFLFVLARRPSSPAARSVRGCVAMRSAASLRALSRMWCSGIPAAPERWPSG